MNLKWTVFLSVFGVGVVLDQITKWWIYTTLEYARDEIVVIPGFLSIVHAQNPGAAMGLLRDYEYRYVLFGIFTLVAVGVIVDLFRKLSERDWFMATTLGLIMSGAVGNGIDRVHKQTVTDFIRVYTDLPSLQSWLVNTFGTSEWPSFNIADSALVVGVGMFLLHYMFVDESESDDDLDVAPEPAAPTEPAASDPPAAEPPA